MGDLVWFTAGICVGSLLGRLRPLQTFNHVAWAKGVSGIRMTRRPIAWALVWCALNPIKSGRSLWKHRTR